MDTKLALTRQKMVQAIEDGAFGKAASLAEGLTLEIRSSYDPFYKKGQTLIQAAALLEEALRRKDAGAISRLGKSFQQEATPLCRALEVLEADFDQHFQSIREAIATGDFEKAALSSRALTRTAKLSQDPNIEKIRRFSPRAALFLSAFEQKDFQGARLILAVTLQAGEILLPGEAMAARQTLRLGKKLLSALPDKERATITELTRAFSTASAEYLKAFREKAERFSPSCEPLPEALKKSRPAALEHLLHLAEGLRFLAPVREKLFLDSLLEIFLALEEPDRAQSLASSLKKRARGLAKESIARNKRLASQRERLLKKLSSFEQAEAASLLIDFLQDRTFQALPGYRDSEGLQGSPGRREGRLKSLFHLP